MLTNWDSMLLVCVVCASSFYRLRTHSNDNDAVAYAFDNMAALFYI